MNRPPHFQTGLCVPDLDAAMAEWGAALGLRWATPQTRVMAGWEVLVVFSLDGPPFIELLEGPAGSPWDCRATGPRIDHVGWWSDELDTERERLRARGFTVELDQPGYCYLRAPVTQLRIELIDSARRKQFYAKWGMRPAGDD